MQPTASVAILQRLVEADVLETSGDNVVLTEAFQSACEEQTVPVEGDGPVVHSEGAEAAESDTERVERYEAALGTFGVDLDDEERAVAAESLATIGEMSGETVTVQGEDLDALFESARNVLVLVYKEGCDPCERVRSKLTTLDADGLIPGDVVIAEVLGTECQRLLWEEYDVMGAPTVLFAREGHIEMRLTGDVHTEQLRSDIQRLYA